MTSTSWLVALSLAAAASAAAAQPAPDPGAPDPAQAPPEATAPAEPTPLEPTPAPAPTAPIERPPRRAPSFRPSPLPGFVVIDRIDGESRAGASLTYVAPNTEGVSGARPTLLRTVVHGRYIDPEFGLGAYLELPFSLARTSGRPTVTTFGDLEGGIVFTPSLPVPELGVIIHAGLTVPTAEEGENEVNTGLITSVVSLPGLYNSLPTGVSVKLGAAVTYRHAGMFVRADLGADGNLEAKGVTIGAALHYDVGVGVELGPGAFTLESENLTLFPTRGNDQTFTLSALAVSARVRLGAVSPYVGVIVPIEHDISDLADFAVTIGTDLKLD